MKEDRQVDAAVRLMSRALHARKLKANKAAIIFRRQAVEAGRRALAA